MAWVIKNPDGSYGDGPGSYYVYEPDSIDAQVQKLVELQPHLEAIFSREEIERQAAGMLMHGAGMQPGSYHGAGVGVDAMRQLYASDPRFRKYLPDFGAEVRKVEDSMSKQVAEDAGAGDDFDFGNLIGAGLAAGVGYLSGGFGLGSLFDSLGSSINVSSGATPGTYVGSSAGELGGGMDWWGTDYLGDFGFPSDAYNAISANDPIGQLIQNLESGMSPSQALSGVESVLPGTTRSALEQLLYNAGSNIYSGGRSLLGSLFGDGATQPSGGRGGLFGGGGLFGNGGFVDRAAASAPVLAAINYARNQDPFDTSRLTSIYDQFNPSALAYDYDLNTGRGRDALTTSLQNRGVLGSSFGNMDITNFNTTRELGRNSLINQGLGQKAQIATNILDADVKARQLKNQLYGSSLLALGNVFGGRSSPTVNFGGI